jgi:hypothetical protein
MRLGLLLVALVAGCAPAFPARSPGPPDEATERALAESEADLQRDDHKLRNAFADARPVDCAQACMLADNICTLAERICTLTGRLPATPERAARCTSARTSCQSARTRVASSCRCDRPAP